MACERTDKRDRRVSSLVSEVVVPGASREWSAVVCGVSLTDEMRSVVSSPGANSHLLNEESGPHSSVRPPHLRQTDSIQIAPIFSVCQKMAAPDRCTTRRKRVSRCPDHDGSPRGLLIQLGDHFQVHNRERPTHPHKWACGKLAGHFISA